MEVSSKIYVAGHRGLVGSAISRQLRAEGYRNVVERTHAELDLTCQQVAADFFQQERPDYVFLAAAKVGGIHANNTYPADFIYSNLMVEANIIHAAYRSGVKKLLFLGSSCIYPRLAPQPIKEEYLMTGELEPTNEPYAMAKLAGISMCNAFRRQYGCNFISVMPTNLYGPGDNFDLENAHVLPALIRKFHEAKIAGNPTVTLWGTGTPRREFLFVDDLARACVFLMRKYDESGIVNIGTGVDHTIAELAVQIADVVGFAGDLVYDTTKPDGTPQKLLDVSKINRLGWQAKTSLEEGLRLTYEWFKAHH
jgi:GDP-L-fucose synthase